MEKIPNFKSGEKGKNEYSVERVRMTNLMNRMSETILSEVKIQT